MRKRLLAVVLVTGMAWPAQAADPKPSIDWDRATQLHQRAGRGEKLSPEDQAYYDRARAEFARRNAAADAGAGQQRPPAESTGFTPLTDGDGEYLGHRLGLYGDGQNTPPEPHLKRALEAAGAVLPRHREGKPTPNGRIVLLSVGMSNTTQEFSRFVTLANADPAKNPRLTIVDGAQGARAADAWSSPERTQTWDEANRRLANAGVTPQQVQVIWLKQALPGPAQLGAFPRHAQRLQQELKGIVQVAQQQYPNLKLIYLSGRTYGGWATTTLNPEPYAYESGFAVQWLIRAQTTGSDPDLAYDKAPILLWGPYLWTDGTKGRKDGLTWDRSDTQADGTHPSPTGQAKVAKLLMDFFKTNPTTKGWFGSDQ